MQKKGSFFLLFFSVVLVFITVLLSATCGVVEVSPGNVLRIVCYKFTGQELIKIDPSSVVAVWELRLPRIVMSLLAGASLALCGAVFQSIFRNPICDPYILGISSGASLGAAVAFVLGWDAFLFGITLPALLTALLTLFVITGIALVSKHKNTQTLLLAGIAVNFLISAVITLLIVVNQQEMTKIIFWTMGSCAASSWQDCLFLLPFVAGVSVIMFYFSKDLNIMQLGANTAQTLGVNVKSVTFWSLTFSSLLIAVVVSLCGVIGFIGLIVPHMVRLLVGSNNRWLFAYSLVLGALFLLIADTLARTIALPSELPVGSITAIAGAPYFIFLLLKGKRKELS